MGAILKVGINGRPLCQNDMRGLARHTLELIKNLHDLNPQMEIYLYTYGQISSLHRAQIPFVIIRESSPRLKIWWDLWILPHSLNRDGVKLFHSTNNVGVPWDSRITKILTLHDDLTHRHRLTRSWKNLWGFLNYQVELWLLKKCEVYITVSQNAAQEIIRTMKLPAKKMRVIYNGINDPISQGSVPRADFYLYVGGLEERKNVLLMIEALERAQNLSSKQTTLVVVAPQRTASDELMSKMKRSPLRIVQKENIPDKELNDLYLQCRALIFPSLFEGFGLPIIEAMQRGTPLILSDLAVFQELTLGKAFFFDPTSIQDLSNLILKLENNPQEFSSFQSENLRRSLDFSWKKMARETMKCYSSLIEDGR